MSTSIKTRLLIINMLVALGGCQNIAVDAVGKAVIPSSYETAPQVAREGSMDAGEKPLCQKPDEATGEPAPKSGKKAEAKGDSKAGANTPSPADCVEIVPWWKRSDDRLLGELVETAIDSNHSLKALEENHLKAWSAFKLARSDLAPTLGVLGNAGYSKSENTNVFLGLKDPRYKPMFEGTPENFKNDGPQGAVALKGEWNLDVFGKGRQEAEAARQFAMSESEKLQMARMLISYEIAKQYYDVVMDKARMESLEKALDATDRMRRYVDGRYRAGETDKLKLFEIDENRVELRSKLEYLKMEREVKLRALRALSGSVDDPKGLFARVAGRDPANLPPLVLPVGPKPAALLENRHDLKSKIHLVKALAARVSSAKRDRYPSLKLNFLFTEGQVKLDMMKDLSFSAGLLGLDVHLPIFTGGRIANNIKRREHELMAAMHDLDDGIVKAVNEINGGYLAIRDLDKLEALKRDKGRMLGRKRRETMEYYKAGESTLDEVIKVELAMAANEAEILDLKLGRMKATIDLYKNLGGSLTRPGTGDRDPDARPSGGI